MFLYMLLVIKQLSTTFQNKGSRSYINTISTSLPTDMLRYTTVFQVYKS